MRKSQVGMVAAVLIFIALSLAVFAQRGRKGNPNPPRYHQNCQFVDNDGDDKYDNYLGQGVGEGTGLKKSGGKKMKGNLGQGVGEGTGLKSDKKEKGNLGQGVSKGTGLKKSGKKTRVKK